MYRDGIVSLAAECARLRAELERLQANARTTRRMTAPQRKLWVLSLAGLVSCLLLVAAAAFAANRQAASELLALRARESALQEAADGCRRERDEIRRDLGRDLDRCTTKSRVVDCTRCSLCCGWSLDYGVRSSAARDLRCPAEDLWIVRPGEDPRGPFLLEGCGREAAYVWARGSWMPVDAVGQPEP
jgi:hypothetical protein